MKRNLRRVIAILMALFLCVGSVSWNELPAKAASAVYSGTDGALTWSIDSDGHLLVEGTGDLENPAVNFPAWHKYSSEIKSATVNVSDITDTNCFFADCYNLTSVDLSGLDTSKVTNMNNMFYYCKSLTNLNLNNFRTENVTTMSNMFGCCYALTEIDISSFNTSKVTNMGDMFYSCKLLTELDLSSFDMANVVFAENMILSCSELSCIKTPKNLNVQTAIPTEMNYCWFVDDSTVMCAEFPLGNNESVVLQKVEAEKSKQPDVGDGSSEFPYEIDEASELIWFAEKVNGGSTTINGILTADIDINPDYAFLDNGTFEKISETTTHFTKWIPIGQYNKIYSGVFDGQNHTIEGIYYNNFGYISDGSIGLFGKTGTSSVIKNINLKNGYISAGGNVGGICGYSDGTIENCHNEMSIIGSGCVGGICGSCINITNCSNEGAIQGSSSSIGGIVGHGMNVTKCYNDGYVKGAYCVGGIAGTAPYADSVLANSYNAGNISGEQYLGGIVGTGHGAPITIENCYNIGTINTNGVELVGFTEGVTFVNNFYLADSESDSFDGTTYKTASQFASGEVAYLLQAAQTGTENVWGQLIGEETHPVSKGVKVYNVENCNGGQYSNSSESKAHNMINKVCVVCGEGKDVNLSGYTISLTGNIAVNFHVQLSEKVLSDSSAYMLFTFADGDTSKVKISDAKLKTDGNKTYYVLTCEVQAPEINDEFTAQIITTVCETEVYTYSVKTYADYILNNTESNDEYAKAAPMVKAMLNYGGYSQKQFGHNTGSLANAGLYTESEDPVLVGTVPTLTEHAFTAPSKNVGVKYYGTSLLLNSETTIRHYFTFTEGEDIAEIREKYEFKLADGTVLTPIMRGGMIYIDIKDISAADLDVKYAVTVTNKETSQTFTFSYSALSYAKYVLDYALAGTNLVNVIKAMYFYNEAANSYFG